MKLNNHWWSICYKTGIDAGNKNITNVKAGVNDTDAVNVKQLKDAKTKLVDGKNTTVEGDGSTATPYKVNVEGDLKGITSISMLTVALK